MTASIGRDAVAWQALVHQFERVVWKAVNMMTTDSEVRDDAFAATWLRLVERLPTIRDPDKLPGWLTTTATNEARQLLRQPSRRHLSIDRSTTNGPDRVPTAIDGDGGDPDRGLVLDETRRLARGAFNELDEECRQLLTVLVLTDPPLSYKEASELLDRPVGSLGPTRQRCLEKLRLMPALRQLFHDA